MNQLTRLNPSTINRSLLGFDTLFNELESRFANQINSNYPPYNVIKHDEDTYTLEIAVTGFLPEEITVEVDQNELIVKSVANRADEDTQTYLHHGLATRNFNRKWTLAEHMEVGEGKIKNGVLTIELKRIVPESLKPRLIQLKVE